MKRKWIASVLTAALLCTGCALFPQEEQLPEAPVLKNYSNEQFTLVAVARGDLIKEATIECSYDPVEEEQLSFSIGGERIAEIYVTAGSQVTKGQLVAELDNTYINNRIAAQQQTVADLERKVAQTKEKLDYHYERLSRLNDAADADYARFDGQRDSANLACLALADEYEYVEQLLAVEQQVLADLLEELSLRKLYAGIDGTVLVVTQSSGSSSTFFAGQTVCTVADLTTGCFQASFQGGLIKEGDTVMINYGEADHEATVTEILEGKSGKKTAKFQLSTPDPTLTAAAKGKITLVTEQKNDVLYLPLKTVKEMENVSIVYYLDENGLKASKVVETGMQANGLVEIVSGLEEGEMVIR